MKDKVTSLLKLISLLGCFLIILNCKSAPPPSPPPPPIPPDFSVQTQTTGVLGNRAAFARFYAKRKNGKLSFYFLSVFYTPNEEKDIAYVQIGSDNYKGFFKGPQETNNGYYKWAVFVPNIKPTSLAYQVKGHLIVSLKARSGRLYTVYFPSQVIKNFEDQVRKKIAGG